jgi:hypothetical protein
MVAPSFLAFENWSLLTMIAVLPRLPVRTAMKMHLLSKLLNWDEKDANIMENQISKFLLLSDSFVLVVTFAVCLRLLGFYAETEWLWRIMIMVRLKLARALFTAFFIVLGFAYIGYLVLTPALESFRPERLVLMFLTPVLGDHIKAKSVVKEHSQYVVIGVLILVIFHVIVVMLVKNVLQAVVMNAERSCQGEHFVKWVENDIEHQKVKTMLDAMSKEKPEKYGDYEVLAPGADDDGTSYWYFADWFSLREQHNKQEQSDVELSTVQEKLNRLQESLDSVRGIITKRG